MKFEICSSMIGCGYEFFNRRTRRDGFRKRNIKNLPITFLISHFQFSWKTICLVCTFDIRSIESADRFLSSCSSCGALHSNRFSHTSMKTMELEIRKDDKKTIKRRRKVFKFTRWVFSLHPKAWQTTYQRMMISN